MCNGEKGKVVKVKVSCRKGDQASLTQVIRAGLKNIPGVGGDKQLGLGGVFRMESGTAKAHVNPDFDVLPENYYDREQMKCVKDFLKFYSFSAPLLCFTCVWTDEPASGETLNLRGSGSKIILQLFSQQLLNNSHTITKRWGIPNTPTNPLTLN